jgi:hypothetical protein
MAFTAYARTGAEGDEKYSGWAMEIAFEAARNDTSRTTRLNEIPQSEIVNLHTNGEAMLFRPPGRLEIVVDGI